MDTILRKSGSAFVAGSLIALLAGAAFGADVKIKLSGDQEVPAVQTQASGSGTITVKEDKSVSGSVKTKGVNGLAAHIHEAPPGKSGPVAIPLEKKSDNEFVVPEGSKLTDAQYQAFKAGNLYVNVHSAAHKDGEIRGQLKP
jgi:hypothetical protein